VDSTGSEKYRSGVVQFALGFRQKDGEKNMGGEGSGNWYRFEKKITTSECHGVGVRYLHREGLLKPGRWFSLR
jgi:hypothetical protein